MSDNPWDQQSMPPPRRGRGGGGWWLLMAAAIGLIALLAWQFPEALETEQDWLHLVYLIGLLALVSSGAMGMRRNRLGESAKQAAVWLTIALVCVAGYGYRYEAQAVGQRVLGELVPGYAANTGEASVTVRAGPNGHYRVQAVVDGARLTFLVDTGASDVVLSLTDARKLGFNPDTLAYTLLYATANGMVRGAPVILGEIAIGGIRVTNVAASVNQAPMAGSLLGMSFLGRLSAYEVRNGSLTLRQ